MTHGSTAATALQVLVVDDSQTQRTRIRSALEQAGLTVVGEAEDGAQAVTQAAAHHPDVVLMDLRMPRMDGVQATRILRRQQPDTPVVLWTGDDDARLDRACAAQDKGQTVAGGRPDSRADASVEGLTAADWLALKQLEASDGFVMRWPVGRQVTRSLANRRLVVVASDYVLLTEAGRRALANDSQRGSRSALPDPDRTEVGAPTRSARAGRGSGGLRAGRWDSEPLRRIRSTQRAMP